MTDTPRDGRSWSSPGTRWEWLTPTPGWGRWPGWPAITITLELFKSVLEGFSIYEEPANNLFEMKTMIQSNPTTAELQRVVEQNRDRATVVNDKAGAKAALGEYLYHMGKTAHRQGQFERAETALVESLVLCDSAEDMRGVAIAVAALAVGAHARARHAGCTSLRAG